MERKVPLMPHIYDMGVYFAKTKQTFRVIKNNQSGSLYYKTDKNSAIDTDSKPTYFYIMPHYGFSTSFFFSKHSNYTINLISIYALGFKILDNLEIIHEAGYVYNDI